MSEARALRGLYAIADTQYLSDKRIGSAVEQAIGGGAQIVQYRDKSHRRGTRRRQAQSLAGLCRVHGVGFIVNDDVDLAAAVDSGVHLGRDDASVAAARARLGPDAVVGVSCYDQLARAVDAEASGASYVAFGSFFASPTKPDAVTATPALLQTARALLHLPIVAIGGITPENGARLIAAGADALAVIHGLFGQGDVAAAARRYAALFNREHA